MSVASGRDQCSVVYLVEVWMDRPGMLRWDIRNKQMFTVFTNMPPLARTPLYIEPIAMKVQTMCCVNRGNIVLGGALENGVLSAGEATTAQYAVQNNSSATIKAIEVSLLEHVAFQARGHNELCTIPLFYARIDAKDCHADVSPRTSGGLVPELDQSLRMMNEVLRSDTTKVPFTVPMHARSSYNGAVIQVYHVLKIKVITSFGTANPEVTRHVTMYTRGAPPPHAVMMHDDEESGFTPLPALPADWKPVVAAAVVVPPMARQASVMHVEHDEHTKMVYPSAPSVDAYPAVPAGGSAVDQLVQRAQASFDVAGDVSTFLAHGHRADELEAEHFFKLFSATKDTFDQLRVADLLATHLTSISCDKLARAAAGAKDMSRREVVEKLLTVQPLVDKQNADAVYRQLTAFEAMTIEKYFK